jgi:hypothetical protein
VSFGSSVIVMDPLEHGRECYERRAWVTPEQGRQVGAYCVSPQQVTKGGQAALCFRPGLIQLSGRARLCSDMVAESSAARLGRVKKLAVFGAVANRGERGVDLDR